MFQSARQTIRNPQLLERAIGFEPMISGFAGRRLWPLGYARSEIGTRGRIRTFTFLFLRQVPLPIWPRVFENAAAGTRTRNLRFRRPTL